MSDLATRYTPNQSAILAWRSYPSDYEKHLADYWLQGLIDTDRDYEARLLLNVLAQRNHLIDLLAAALTPGDD